MQHIRDLLASALAKPTGQQQAAAIANLTATGLVSCNPQHGNCVIHPHGVPQNMPAPPFNANPIPTGPILPPPPTAK